MKLSEIDLPLLDRVVAVYLELAYPSGSIPDAVQERLRFAGESIPEILGSERFEKQNSIPPAAVPGRFTLRLGSDRYPHMKMVLERCANCEDFFFSVDTHDRHFLMEEPIPQEKRARWAALQEYNRLLKQAIESAWEREEIPTFCSYTRSRMVREKTSSPVSPAEGHPTKQQDDGEQAE